MMPITGLPFWYFPLFVYNLTYEFSKFVLVSSPISAFFAVVLGWAGGILALLDLFTRTNKLFDNR
jgi:hypothetical protein